MSKLIIACGGRFYKDYGIVLDAVAQEAPTFLIAGGAPGADTLAVKAAYELSIPHVIVPALWGAPESRIRKAGFDRNMLMMKMLLRLAGDNEKAVVAFPGGTGTQMMIKIAKNHDVEVRHYQ